MIQIEQVNSVAGAIAFAAWLLVVLGVRQAVFASFIASEIWSWWEHESWPNRKRLMEIKAELNATIQYNSLRLFPMKLSRAIAAEQFPENFQPLSAYAFDRLLAERKELSHVAIYLRPVLFFTQCQFCQLLWTALLVQWIVGWPGTLSAALTAFGCAAVGALILSRRPNAKPGFVAPPTGKPAGSGCGQ